MKQVDTVLNQLKYLGYAVDGIVIYGGSTGGGLVSGTVLKMRDDGTGMPAAVVLWSPWTDITGMGDSFLL